MTVVASFALAGTATIGAANASPESSTRPVTASSARARSGPTLDQQALERQMLDDVNPPSERPSAPVKPIAVRNMAPLGIGQWAKPIATGGVLGIHSVVLDTGKVLLFGPKRVPVAGAKRKPKAKAGAPTYEIQTVATVFDPVTGTFTRDDPPEDDDVFCGAQTVLGDGTVLVVGGLDPYDGWEGSHGTAVVLLFDPNTLQWTEAAPMRQGRWYPTATELADGSAVVVGGRDVNNKPNNDIEQIGPMPSIDPQLVGTSALDATQVIYPNQFLLPNGHVFSFEGTSSNIFDPSTWRIDRGPFPLAPQLRYPNAVVLPITEGQDIQMVVYGGGRGITGPAESLSERVDLSSPTPAFTALTPMPQPRTNMNSVLLPDGTILVVGGAAGDKWTSPYLQSLLYDPVQDMWTAVASQTLRRAYHSTAVLLPDGRVLSAGDNGPAPAGRETVEIYSPPYLFKGPRPVITQAPVSAAPGSTNLVDTTGPVTNAVLISPAATTHATNMHQRFVNLPSVPSADHGMTVTIPDDGTVPPGPYMLFVLDAHNIPSVASWVMVT